MSTPPGSKICWLRGALDSGVPSSSQNRESGSFICPHVRHLIEPSVGFWEDRSGVEARGSSVLQFPQYRSSGKVVSLQFGQTDI